QQTYRLEAALPELALLLLLGVGPLRDPLTNQPHPPRDVAQATADLLQPLGVVEERIELRFARLLHPDKLLLLPFLAPPFADRTQLQPTQRYLFVVPALHYIRTRAEDQMQVVGHDGKDQQVDAKAGRQALQLVLDPSLAMVVVLACH